jgi:uncharacterized protein
MSEKFDIPFDSPIAPIKLDLHDEIQFQCSKGIACFNKCCQSIDITLTPYDVARLRRRLGLSSKEFLHLHTVPFPMDGQGMPGIKLKTGDESRACPFVTEAGCSVYEDRPSACRYYALGSMSMRKFQSATDEQAYFVVKEEHCLGHLGPRKLTVAQYREEQGVVDYDEINLGWRQVVLKKRSSGPTVGKPSQRSSQLFFMASYDMEGFRAFIQSEGFQQLYDIDGQSMQEVMESDEALVPFAAKFLKQVLFGEHTLPMRKDATEKRRQAREASIKARVVQERGEDADVRYDEADGD